VYLRFGVRYGYMREFISQLDYVRARWYDPTSERWMSRDRVTPPREVGAYSYGANRPPVSYDPSGTVAILLTDHRPDWCGAATDCWTFKDGRLGAVVQHIVRTEQTVCPCVPTPSCSRVCLMDMCDTISRPEFWEAWNIDAQGNFDPGSNDCFSTRRADNQCSPFYVLGHMVFFLGYKASPPGWSKGSPPCTNINMWYTMTDPKIWNVPFPDSKALAHYKSVAGNCCGVEGRTIYLALGPTGLTQIPESPGPGAGRA